jgi:Uma2 family endonuclease
MTYDSMASTSNLGAVVDWSYPENPMSVVMETWLPRHRFDVDEYHRMKELGILKPSDEVELLEGWIVDSTDRIADEGGAIDSRESKAMDAVPDSWIPFHRFTVEEYYRMAEIGLFAADARVELIEGEIIDMTPIGPRHCGIVDWLARQFQMRLGERSIVRTQGVVRLGAYGEPQPDLALLPLREHFYQEAHPVGSDTFLVVEVSDSSLQKDQMVKVPLYAHYRVPEVWVVDLMNDRLYRYRSPVAGDYSSVSSTDDPGTTEITALPGLTIDLSKLFGR